MTAARIAVLGLLAGAGFSCGDDAGQGPADDATTTRDDAGAEVEADADAIEADADAIEAEDGTAEIPDDGGGGTTVVLNVKTAGTEDNLSDVTVVVETSSGTMTGTTDVDGNASFDGIDFAGDPPTITFFRTGYSFETYVGVDRPFDGSIGLTPLEGYTTTRVAGTVSGLAPGQDAMVSINTAFGSQWVITTAGGAYIADIVGASDWTEIGGQALAFDRTSGAMGNWAEGTAPFNITGPVTFDLALPAVPTPVSRATVSFEFPPGFDAYPAVPTPSRDPYWRGHAEVRSGEFPAYERLGLAEAVAATTTPAGFEITVGWLGDLGGAAPADVITIYSIPGVRLVDIEQHEAGVPSDGATIAALEPPVFSTPASPTTRFRLSTDTAEWTVPDWSSYTVLWLYDGRLENLLWRVTVPKAVTSFRFPLPPETFPPLPSPMYLGILVLGWEGAPASPYELFQDDTFDGRFIGRVYDIRYGLARP